MQLAYGSKPKDILAYIGPSISKAHFEVSEDTAMTFRHLGPAYGECAVQHEGTWRVDLWKANHLLLTDAGLIPEHIETTESCVFDRDDRFFSYRRDGGHTGRMGAFAIL